MFHTYFEHCLKFFLIVRKEFHDLEMFWKVVRKCIGGVGCVGNLLTRRFDKGFVEGLFEVSHVFGSF